MTSRGWYSVHSASRMARAAAACSRSRAEPDSAALASSRPHASSTAATAMSSLLPCQCGFRRLSAWLSLLAGLRGSPKRRSSGYGDPERIAAASALRSFMRVSSRARPVSLSPDPGLFAARLDCPAFEGCWPCDAMTGVLFLLDWAGGLRIRRRRNQILQAADRRADQHRRLTRLRPDRRADGTRADPGIQKLPASVPRLKSLEDTGRGRWRAWRLRASAAP